MFSPMGGIFNAPNNRFRPPTPDGQSAMSTPPAPSNDRSMGRIMPPGNAMGMPTSAQNSFMPQGATMGPGTPGSGMPEPPPQQMQEPLNTPDFNARAPIMDPNNNFKLDALKAGVLNEQSPTVGVGTPTQNTPSTNMQQVPFLLNQLRMGANAPGM